MRKTLQTSNFKLTLLAAMMSMASSSIRAQVTPTSMMESLGRGVLAIPAQSGKGQFVSWRLLGTDDEQVTFDVIRDGTLIARDLNGATSFTDRTGTSSSKYKVVAKVDGKTVSTSATVTPWSDLYISVQLDRPSDIYTPNDMSVGDVDGDGEYELIVKWDPSDSKDNANSGTSSKCIIDCYRLNGTKLWRVDLGSNIRSGAHYTQFLVYDFDGDGKAEMMCKTAPGTKDGKGNYVSAAADDSAIKSTDNSKSYVSSGRILSGPEFLTVFNGLTGAAIHTIWYNPNRAGNYGRADDHPAKSFWGDSSGNRGDRHLAAVAHLGGGKTASGVFVRGYYTRAYLWAVDYSGGKLSQRWLHCSSSKTAYSVTDANGNTSNYTNSNSTSGGGSATMYGNGNHNLSVADVDGDGCDEIIWGSAACDHNGKLLYAVGFGHGDAMHLADLVPDRPGLEVFDVHENKGTYAWDLHDAATGEVLLKGGPSGVDNGRGLAAQVSADHRESFFSSAGDNQTRSCATGDVISEYGPTINNFRIYWDGDLQDELLGDISRHNNPFLEKWNGNGYSRMYVQGKNLYQIGNSMTINSTKGVPCLQADILGDWREEMIFYDGSDPSKINIFTTNIPTSYRVVTLMHDHVYRMGVAWQNVAYNQPPHLGYYLPDYAKSGVVVVEPDDTNLKDFYTQDYDSETDASSWHFGTVERGTLSLEKGDANYGSYIQYAVGDRSNSAYTLFSSGEHDDYVLQFDAALTPGNTDGSEFHVMSEGGNYAVPNNNKYWQSYAGYNNNLHSLLYIRYDKSNVGVINNSDVNAFEFTAGEWCHYRLKVSGSARTVEYLITKKSDNSLIASGTYAIPAENSIRVQGIYVLNGRYNGSTKVDNIRISTPAEPGPDDPIVITDPVDPELSFSEEEVSAELGQAFTSPVLDNPYSVEVEWLSEDETVATVDANGLVTLVGAGETVITASFLGNDDYLSSTATYKLTVTGANGGDSDLTDIYVQDYENENDASSWQLGVTGRGDLALQTDDAEFGKYISYSTGNNNGSNAAYTLFNSGNYTSYVLQFDMALGAGNTDGSEFIVMSEGGNYPASNSDPYWQSYILLNGGLHSLLSIEYNKNNTNSINYTSSDFTVSAGAWYHVRLEVNGQDRTVAYKISDYYTKAIATEGTYNLPDANSTKVQGIYVRNGRSNGYSRVDNIRISVPAGAAEPIDPELSFSVAEANGELGQTFTSPALTNPYGVEVVWKSQNKNVATVNQNGKVTLVGAGETVISATFAGNDEYLPATASYKLTVAEVIEPIDPELAFSVTEVNAVLEQAFTSPVLANPYGVEVEWQSEDETVATVDQNGKVTLVGEGETVISVTFSGNDEYLPATASYTLNVNLPTNIMLLSAIPADAVIYSITGQRLSKPRKGLNIINGKMVVVK